MLKKISELKPGMSTKRGVVTHILEFPADNVNYGLLTIVTDSQNWTASPESRIWVNK